MGMQTKGNKVANSNKATHKGSCQCCGRVQMLPAGVLSKHGYTVDWGFFNGVCQGAGHKPFEQDFSLVSKFIAYAEKQLAGVLAQQVELRKPATENKAWVHAYKPATYRRGDRGGYYWLQTELVETSHTYVDKGGTEETISWLSWTYMVDGKSQQMSSFPHDVKTTLEACTYLNARRAEDLEKTVKEIEAYIKWQQARIANWEPQSLIKL